MILAAIIIGLIAAYYLGLRAGGLAAAASALLFIVAAVVPGATLWIYAAVSVGLILLFAYGPRLQQDNPEVERARRLFRLARRAVGRLWSGGGS